jgi:hypothetical protein
MKGVPHEVAVVAADPPVRQATGEGCSMLKGSCLCGIVSYEIHGAIQSARFCHCVTCRKFSGAAVAPWGLVATAHLIVTGPESNIAKYDSGGGLRAFCSSCGSPLWYEPANLPAFRGVPLGVIDEGLVPTPEMHVWTKSKASWASIDDELPQHETHP